MGAWDELKALAGTVWEAGATAPAALAPPPVSRAASWQGFNPAGARAAASSTEVSHRTVSGIPAFDLAERIASEAVASLEFGIWRGDGVERQRARQTWQSRLFDYPNPDQSPALFWETIEASLTSRSNAYMLKMRGEKNIVEVWALHPDQVTPRWAANGSEIHYRILAAPPFLNPFGSERKTVTVSARDMLHIRGHGAGGLLVAPTPIERFRDSLGSAIAKVRHEERTFSQGTMAKLGIELPADITKERAEAFKKLWQESNAGPENAGKAAVLGGGGTIKTIGLSLADAQFVEAMDFSVQEIGRITNVLPSLLGSGGDAKPISAEHELGRWLRLGLAPRLRRIEAALGHDLDLFGPASRVYPHFRDDEFLRGDIRTEAAVAVSFVQAGVWTPDEARATHGMPPLPDGIGSIPQITPVGGAPNADPNPLGSQPSLNPSPQPTETEE